MPYSPFAPFPPFGPPAPVHPLPPCAGIGLRAPHVVEFVESAQAQGRLTGFIEVHSENYFGRGGRPLHWLQRARRDHPLSLHGVGLSIGGCDPLDGPYLDRLADLIERVDPVLVSDHLCFSSAGGVHAHDLLPLPYTDEALDHVVARLQQVQQRLGRTILIENPSRYVAFAGSTMGEAEFLAEAARRSGCGILLDVNNVFVSACNLGLDAGAYLRALPVGAVRQIHLAGHLERRIDGAEIMIDSHSRPVAEAVWSLYRDALARFGPLPTLVEWDADLPPLDRLLAEAAQAERWLAAAGAASGRQAAIRRDREVRDVRRADAAAAVAG